MCESLLELNFKLPWFAEFPIKNRIANEIFIVKNLLILQFRLQSPIEIFNKFSSNQFDSSEKPPNLLNCLPSIHSRSRAHNLPPPNFVLIDRCFVWKSGKQEVNLNFYCSTLSDQTRHDGFFSRGERKKVVSFCSCSTVRVEVSWTSWEFVFLLSRSLKISWFLHENKKKRKETATTSSSSWEKSLNIQHYDLHILVGDTALDEQSCKVFAPQIKK